MQQHPVYDHCKGRAICPFFEKTHTHIVGVSYPSSFFLSIPLSLFTLMLNVCIKISPLKLQLCFNLKFFPEANPWILVLLEYRSLKRLRELLSLLRGTAWSCISGPVTIDSLRILPTVFLQKCLKCILVSRLSQSPGPSQLSQRHLPQQSSELMNPILAISFSEGRNWLLLEPQVESYPASFLMTQIRIEV